MLSLERESLPVEKKEIRIYFYSPWALSNENKYKINIIK